MTNNARAIRYLDKPDGIRVEVLAVLRDGYVKVRTPSGRTFETLASRLHKAQ